MLIIAALTLLAAQTPTKLNEQIPANIRPKSVDAAQILATVDGKSVTVSDVEPMVWALYHRPITHDFVDFLVVKDAAAADKVSVSDDEVNARMQTVFDRMRASLRPGETLEQALLSHEYSDARLFLRVKTQLLLEKIQMLTFHPGDWAHISVIEFPTPGKKPDVMKQEATTAKEYYDKLRAGASWDQLQSQSTSNPTALRTKGDVGWRLLSSLPPEARTQLASLKAGEVTAPIETPTSIVIFKLDTSGRTAAGPELELLKNTYFRATGEATLKAISTKAKVEWTKSE